MARYRRILSQTKIYHAMVRGNEKKQIFLDDEDRQKFIDVLRVKKTENNFELYAYCLMDNHVHLLLNEKEQSVARIMKCINVSYAMYFNRKYERVGHLFQDRFKSEIIDSDAYLLTAANYIHNNPVKAGLVEEAGDYQWSSYKDYTGTKAPGCITDAAFVLGIISSDREKAMEAFIELAGNGSEKSFLDIADEVELDTRQKVLAFIEQYLADKGLTYNEVISLKGRIIGSIKHELVKVLKSKSCMGSRELGKLLGMSKSTVNKLLRD